MSQDKLTIDFKFRSKGQKKVLSCGGVADTEVDCREAKFSESGNSTLINICILSLFNFANIILDTKKLYKDVGRARDQNSIIVECSFDTVSGKLLFCF